MRLQSVWFSISSSVIALWQQSSSRRLVYKPSLVMENFSTLYNIEMSTKFGVNVSLKNSI